MVNWVQRFIVAGFCLAVAICISAPLYVAQAATGNDDDKPRRQRAGNEYITPGWIVVKFRENVQVGEAASKTGLAVVDRMAERFGVQSVQKLFPMLDLAAGKASALKGVENLQRIYRFEIDSQIDPRAAAGAFSTLSDVEYAEPLYRHRLTSVSSRPAWFEPYTPILATPNDPQYAAMTHLEHINLPAAWDVVKGEDGSVVIAVVDGGTDWKHPDLMGNIWTNPEEIPDDGIDNDGNELIDDVHGWNFANSSPDPTGLPSTPINASHGTQTVGIIGAVTNNNVGVAGASWNAVYMPINIACPESDEALCYPIAGIVYATIMEADIVSFSAGSPFFSLLEEEVIEFATSNGTLVVAAAGNQSGNNDIIPHYPANYRGVLPVGATNKDFDAIASFSNFGISVDIYAPGINLETTASSNNYASSSGTSFSAPLSAAIAGLVKTQHPDWSADQVREQVRVTADDISLQNNTFRYRGKLGKGRLNALRAVSEATPSMRILSADIRNTRGGSRIGPGELATVTVDVINYLEPISNLNVTLESTASSLVVTQPNATIASLGSGENAEVEFQVVTAADVPFNVQANLNTRFSSGDYRDVDGFSVVVNSTIHNTGTIEVQLTEEGNLGWEEFQEQSDGIGFRYQGGDFLFEGGLIFGNGPTTISDNVRADDTSADIQEMDFVREAGSKFGIIDGRETAEEGALTLVDTDADTPLNIRVRQDSYADTSEVNRDFIVLRYTIENMGDSEISNFYAGLFFDWDSYFDPASDYARFEAGRRMGYFLNGSPGDADVFLATKLLSSDGELSWKAIDNTTEIYGGADINDPNDGFTETEKWDFLSGGVQTESLDVTDVSTMLSAGPFMIAPGESVVAAFAIVAGTTLEDLQMHADAAQDLWNNKLSSLGPNPVAVEEPGTAPQFTFALENPYPNPVRDEATIDFELPNSGAVQLRIYDVLGREVRTLREGTERAGRHTVVWDGRDNAGQSLASGVYMISLISPTDDGLRSATKKVVIVR